MNIAIFSFVFLLVIGSYAVGVWVSRHDMGQIKRENEELNTRLKKLTDRDERGRFKK